LSYDAVSNGDCIASLVGQVVRKGFGRTEETHENLKANWCPSKTECPRNKLLIMGEQIKIVPSNTVD
jgi:hypothetical protein